MEEWSWERKVTTNLKLQEYMNEADDEVDEWSWWTKLMTKMMNEADERSWRLIDFNKRGRDRFREGDVSLGRDRFQKDEFHLQIERERWRDR